MSNTTIAMAFSLPPETGTAAPIHCNYSFRENLSSLQLDSNPSFVYSAGDTVSGTYEMFVNRPFKANGVLAVLDGTIFAVVRGSNGRKWTDTVTNLHKFTYIVKSPTRRKMLFSVGTHTYRFSIRIPHTNLPGTFLGENGKIKYRVMVFEDRDDTTYQRFDEQPIFLKSYFNLCKFTSLDDLATQSWQTKKMQYVSSIFSGSGKTCKSRSSCQDSFLELSHRNLDLKTVLTISKTCFIPGEIVNFEIRTNVKNASSRSNVVVVVVSLVSRIVYTASSATVVTRELCRVEKTFSPTPTPTQSWADLLTIPADLEMASSMSAKVQPIIFQYFLRLEVRKNPGKVEPLLSGELLIVVGTTRNPGHPDPKNLILDIAKCEYPIGFTAMKIPEDWDRMHKTGRIGYFESENNVNNVGPKISYPSSISSQFGPVSVGILRSDSELPVASSSLPAYSTLSSRRTSIETLPPTYEDLFEVEIIEDT